MAGTGHVGAAVGAGAGLPVVRGELVHSALGTAPEGVEVQLLPYLRLKHKHHYEWCSARNSLQRRSGAFVAFYLDGVWLRLDGC